MNSEQRTTVERTLAEHGFEPVLPAVANFLFVDTGRDAAEVFQELLRLGVIVRPLGGFGAPEAIRVTVGAPDENVVSRRSARPSRARVLVLAHVYARLADNC